MTRAGKSRRLRDDELDRTSGGFDEADALFGKKKPQATQDSRAGVGILKSTDSGGTWG